MPSALTIGPLQDMGTLRGHEALSEQQVTPAVRGDRYVDNNHNVSGKPTLYEDVARLRRPDRKRIPAQ